MDRWRPVDRRSPPTFPGVARRAVRSARATATWKSDRLSAQFLPACKLLRLFAWWKRTTIMPGVWHRPGQRRRNDPLSASTRLLTTGCTGAINMVGFDLAQLPPMWGVAGAGWASPGSCGFETCGGRTTGYLQRHLHGHAGGARLAASWLSGALRAAECARGRFRRVSAGRPVDSYGAGDTRFCSGDFAGSSRFSSWPES